MATNWVKVMFSGTDKLFDILNVGRLIFYTAGGLLAVYPLTLLAGLLAQSAPPPGGMLTSIAPPSADAAWLLFFFSLVAGFVLALIAFQTLTAPAYKRVLARIGQPAPNEFSFNYRYPLLRNDREQDYQAWLIAEYFRYVEIATLIPLGFVVGVGGLTLYPLVYLLHFGPAALDFAQINSALLWLIVGAAALALIRHYLWPCYWRPLIVEPTVQTFIRAKANLIAGLEALPAAGGGAAAGQG